MTQALWQLSATELAARIKARECSAEQATASVLQHIARHNPRINALAEVMAEEALSAARACDAAQAAGLALGALHGVPVTVKINVDCAGHATTDGIVAGRDNLALEDSPLVGHLRRAGAVIVGRSNAPAFSLRWFTSNDLHGRTLNPFDAGITPGGSSGGAAAAVAMGFCAIAHGNDYGGSVRHPAYACGVVGLRTTVGRIPSYKASAPLRSISHQMMSVQGPLTRTVADARLALRVMAQGSPLDPQWVDAPLEYPDTAARPLRVAVFAQHPAYELWPGVSAAMAQAAQALAAAGCELDQAVPPRFEEGAALWRQLVVDDLRRSAAPTIDRLGDAGVRAALAGYMHGLPTLSADALMEAQAQRFSLCREWAVFLQRFDVLLMPTSWAAPFAVDADCQGPEAVATLLAAQSPLLGTAMMGLPGLSVPTGLHEGLPTGVQLVSARFREDLALHAGELIERAAGFSALQCLKERDPKA